ncbi:MAG: hypothetical protein RMI94_12175 [Bryobacterales bacterium]|nr:hypothetical protein [Bryobacteraceae bacterium]MDW8131302.1 hypothetical protein [Bryobacterales bacterium]
MRAILPIAVVCLLTGCTSYRDFTLPLPDGPVSDPEFAWEVLPHPVLSRGGPGEFDSVDALNPSVVFKEGRYYNFYSGWDGRQWRTGLAISDDGLRWCKRGPVLAPDPSSWEGDYIAANGSALLVESEFYYWYQAARPPRIGLARSRDGVHWSKRGEPVLGLGPRGSWDERAVADPYVFRVGDWFYMYYLGEDRARRQRLGVARSRDGIRWQKLRTNPVLELGEVGAFDEAGLGEPAVWASHGWYWMLYTGRDRQERRRIGLARSRDGVRWQRISPRPVFEAPAQWASAVICDPSVLVSGGELRVWFGGGDRPRPDENLNGQIGLAVARFRP